MKKHIALYEKQFLKCALDYNHELPADNIMVSPFGRVLYDVIRHCRTQSIPLIFDNILAEAVGRAPDIQPDIIEDLFSTQVSDNFDYYLSRIKKEYYADKFSRKTLEKILETTQTVQTHEDLVSSVEALAYSLLDDIREYQGKFTKFYEAEDLSRVYDTVLLDRFSDKDQSIPIGDPLLREYFYGRGFARGSITIIYGHSGVGKSIYALNLMNSQINIGVPCIFANLEMGLEPTLDRFVSLRTSIPMTQLSNVSDPVELARIQEMAKKELNSLPAKLHFIDDAALSIQDLDQIIAKKVSTWGTTSIVVFVDLLTMLKDFSGEFKASIYEDALNHLHQVVRRWGVALVGVVQARRHAEKVSVKSVADLRKYRPTIEQLKNSSALEERSRVVLGVFRKKHFALRLLPDNPDVKNMDDIMEVSILKNNLGPLGTVHYLYSYQTAEIKPLRMNKDDLEESDILDTLVNLDESQEEDEEED